MPQLSPLNWVLISFLLVSSCLIMFSLTWWSMDLKLKFFSKKSMSKSQTWLW